MQSADAAVAQPPQRRRRLARTTVDRFLGMVAARTFPLYAGLVALYVLFRVGSFTNKPVRLTDTVGYEQAAHRALWDWHFWAGLRGFTIPLFFKIVPTAESRIVVQLVLSIAAWLVLAAVVGRAIRTKWLRFAAVLVVLGLSTTTEVVLWDALLLSESITFALAALLVAAWLSFVRAPRRSAVAAILVVSVLWSFARDTNAYVLAAVAILVALTAIRPSQRRLKAVLAVGCAAIAALTYASADVGKRWVQPMEDIVNHRVIPSPPLERYFQAHGLRPGTNWVASGWLERRSRSVYVDYLVSHPGYALAGPFHGRQQVPYSTARNVASLLDPELAIYNDNASSRFLPLPRATNDVFFPRGVALLCVLIVVALALTGLARLPVVALVPLGLLVTTYPHFLVVWHQSGLEVDRHALEASLLLRVALFLLLLFALDRLLVRTAGALASAVSRTDSSERPSAAAAGRPSSGSP
jgi:hypothetical protein